MKTNDHKDPFVPGKCKTILLDIEGCTTSISFVTDVLFPYVLRNLDDYVESLSEIDLTRHMNSLKNDVDTLVSQEAKNECQKLLREWKITDESSIELTTTQEKHMITNNLVNIMMKYDAKATGLKNFQGKMWKDGYTSGKLKGHVYDDFPLFLKKCQQLSVRVNIFSSGSKNAQKLLYSNSIIGDLTSFIHDYFDTTSGGGKESQSYHNIAESLGTKTSEICFISDNESELVAAREAGVGFVIMSVRPGNAEITDVGHEFPQINSLMQIICCNMT